MSDPQAQARTLQVRNPYTGEFDTHYGLSAAVLAGTAEEAARIGERINAGTVSLQDTFLTLFKTRDIGTNSFGDSGLGG